MVYFPQDWFDFQEVYSGVPHVSVLVLHFYNSAPTSELQNKLQLCVDNVHHGYHMNRLTINKKKSAVMVIGSKSRLQFLNLAQFSINVESNQIEIVN